MTSQAPPPLPPNAQGEQLIPGQLNPLTPPIQPSTQADQPAGPLNALQLSQLQDAQRDAKKLRRAASMAKFNGWWIVSFGSLTLLFGLGSIPAMLLGAGMVVVAIIEFRGASGLRRLDETASTKLGFNQLFFAAILIAYAVWMLYIYSTGQYEQSQRLTQTFSNAPSVARTISATRKLSSLIAQLIFGSLIIGALTFQGGTAWFYFRTRKRIIKYKSKTPHWIVQMQQQGIGI